jgi:DNA polymerase-4
MEAKYILLADMNAFFASCHQSTTPSLRNKPVIVGGSPTNKRKGMVIAASYEAKKQGVFTTMNSFEANKICPNAIFVQRDHSLYNTYSTKIMDFLRLIGNTEVASIDEAYVDITSRVENGTSPGTIATYIQQMLWNKIRIPCSIGVGPNRIIAKMAADVKKPHGYVMMGIRQYQTFFHPKPLHQLHGCGAKTAEKLNKHGIETIGALAAADPATIRVLLGQRGAFLQDAARGLSSSAVDPDRDKGDKTIGKETTFAEPLAEPDQVMYLTDQIIQRLASKLKDKTKRAKTVSLVYKTERGGPSHSKSLTMSEPTNDPERLLSIARTLYQEYLWETPFYLFGVRLANFEDATYQQLSFRDFEMEL